MKILACNSKGYRVGASHQRAVISDSMVLLLRHLHAQQGYGRLRLARMFGLRTWTVQDVLDGTCRVQDPVRWRVNDDDAAGRAGGRR